MLGGILRIGPGSAICKENALPAVLHSGPKQQEAFLMLVSSEARHPLYTKSVNSKQTAAVQAVLNTYKIKCRNEKGAGN